MVQDFLYATMSQPVQPRETEANGDTGRTPAPGPHLEVALYCLSCPVCRERVQRNISCPTFLVTLQAWCAMEGRAHIGIETFLAIVLFIMGHAALGGKSRPLGSVPHLQIRRDLQASQWSFPDVIIQDVDRNTPFIGWTKKALTQDSKSSLEKQPNAVQDEAVASKQTFEENTALRVYRLHLL